MSRDTKDVVGKFAAELLVWSAITAAVLFFVKFGMSNLYEIVQLFQK